MERIETSAGSGPTLRLALAEAQALGPASADGLRLDRTVLAELTGSPDRDASLATLELEALAALLDRCAARLDAGGGGATPAARADAWAALDLIRRPAVLRRIPPHAITDWSARILRLVRASHLTTGRLFQRRAEAYGSKVLFELPPSAGSRVLSWRQTAGRVDAIARGLLSLDAGHGLAPVAILSDNCIEMALTDLACFRAGLVTVMLPANSTSADVGFMLGHASARTLVVSGPDQLHKAAPHIDRLGAGARVVVLDPRTPLRHAEEITLDAVIARAPRVDAAELDRRLDAVQIDDLATLMYTSGSTGRPKAIRFTHANLVFKRFARALALPEIGESDVFLCYLPLCHTFGRFLEMLGSVFWGATYCLLDNPSVEALVQGMRRHRPTVFISVPKKWMQLHEAAAQIADPVTASDAALRDAAHQVTGGRLRWGLSAAGHLSPEVFRYFQDQGIELMSGFGMTEATGGITMTPPGSYRDGSLGRALPGIETRLAADGELLIRGPYVMEGYLDPPAEEPGFDVDGWLHTGDLMEQDADGHLRLIDRKKEIYKNVKGETVAPQRVEALFRDFESVARVFVVGDHREYNTALIVPHPEYRDTHLRGLSPGEVKAHYRPLVVSVNTFLAPFERIVDFAVIDRDLDPERGELTAKHTPRRRVVESNFADVIRLLYRRTDLQVGGTTLTFPNWLFQTLGLTAQDLEVQDGRVVLAPTGASLTASAGPRGTSRVGSCMYRHPPGAINLGVLLSTPRLWLGNEELVAFVQLDPAARDRPRRFAEGLEWAGRAPAVGPAPARRPPGATPTEGGETTVLDLHDAALSLLSDDEAAASDAVRRLGAVLARGDTPLSEAARVVLGRAADAPFLEVRRQAFRALVPWERETRFPATLRRFLETPGIVLDASTRGHLCETTLPDPIIDACVAAAADVCLRRGTGRASEARAAALLRFLADYGASHPTRYARLRAFLVRVLRSSDRPAVRREAERAVQAIEAGFREWLGPMQKIAVDAETGQEYRWEDVLVFDDAVDAAARQRLSAAVRSTAFLREAVFLFSGGVQIRLSDIPPGGVWIRPLESSDGKSVFRCTVQTRFQGAFDLAAVVNRALERAAVREEIHDLILCGESPERGRLVEEFGGYWPEMDVWSEEFVAGDALERVARRLARNPRDAERLRQMWPFWVWSALAAYVDFWDRTGRRQELLDASLANVIVPTDDFHAGARIVSISARRPHAGLLAMIRSFRESFVASAEERHPVVRGLVGWDLILSAVLEVTGEREGLRLLHELLRQDPAQLGADLRHEVSGFAGQVEERGFMPMRVHFAVQRYRRWAELSPEATSEARARTLQELYETYGLGRLASSYPEARVRLFLQTVLRNASPALVAGLEEIVGRLRRREIDGDDLLDAVSDLRAKTRVDADEDAFLARLGFPHLRPEDRAAFVPAELGGRRRSEMMVVLEDRDGDAFRVRHALNPKEVGQIYRLFLQSRLDVRFGPEHHYLLALNERRQIIAGLYYEIEEDGLAAHLEKIAVAEQWRKKGVAEALLNEFFSRLRAAGLRTVTTGFFRPEFFYALGFVVDRRYAGLVKVLDPV